MTPVTPYVKSRDKWASNLDNFLSIDIRLSVKSFPAGNVNAGDSLLRLFLELEVVLLVDGVWLVFPMMIL